MCRGRPPHAYIARKSKIPCSYPQPRTILKILDTVYKTHACHWHACLKFKSSRTVPYSSTMYMYNSAFNT